MDWHPEPATFKLLHDAIQLELTGGSNSGHNVQQVRVIHVSAGI